MTTFNRTTFRTLALAPLFAAFAVHAANASADQAVDTQSQMQSVLRGTAAFGTTTTRYSTDSRGQSQGFDAQAQARRVLLGETNSGRPSIRVASTGIAVNVDVRGMTQGVLLGRVF